MNYIQTDLSHIDIALLIEEAYGTDFDQKYSPNQVSFLNENYPNFIERQKNLYEASYEVLKNYSVIQELAEANKLDVFAGILYQFEDTNYENFNYQEFVRNSLKVLLNDVYGGDLNRANLIENDIQKIYQNDTINFDTLLSYIMQLEESDEQCFKIIKYFKATESIYFEFQDIMENLKPIYSEFKTWCMTTYGDLFTQEPDHEAFYQWVDIDSFDQKNHNGIFYDFSVINTKGLVAKIAVNDNSNTYVLYGIFFSKEIRSNYDSIDIEKVKYYFLALGDDKRFRIFEHLMTGEYYLKELAELLELTSPTVSHHMDIFTKAGIVKLREKGKKIYYSINPEAVTLLAQFFAQLEESLRNQHEDVTS